MEQQHERHTYPHFGFLKLEFVLLKSGVYCYYFVFSPDSIQNMPNANLFLPLSFLNSLVITIKFCKITMSQTRQEQNTIRLNPDQAVFNEVHQTML